MAQAHPQDRIVIISRDTKQGIDQYIKTTGFKLPIVEDANGSLAKRFNASWVPRVYQIDTSGTLRWVQHEDTIAPEQTVQQLWKVQKGEGK